MTDTAKLKTKIKESGYKLGYIAFMCRISPRTLNNKINGRAEFVQREIFILKILLHLSEKDVGDIFFAAKGELNSPKPQEAINE